MSLVRMAKKGPADGICGALRRKMGQVEFISGA
jgi:hypothetical protein